MRLSQSVLVTFVLVLLGVVLSSRPAEADPYCINNHTDKRVTVKVWEDPPTVVNYQQEWIIEPHKTRCEGGVPFWPGFFEYTPPLTLKITHGDGFECILPLKGTGVGAVAAKDRSDLGISVPLDYCATYDVSDPDNWKLTGLEPSWYGEESKDRPRAFRFFATADPQYPQDSQVWRDIADRTLNRMNGMLAVSSPTVGKPRGIVIAGDLTADTVLEELEHYKATLGPLQRYYFDGLGNHDLGMPAQCLPTERCPAETLNYVLNRRRSTVPTNFADGIKPHYSWDWHDVHFVQLNLMPSDRPSLNPLNVFDPMGALTFLKEDLAENVGDSGRPVIVIHHYGLDDLSKQDDPGVISHIDPLTQKPVLHKKWWDTLQQNEYWEALANYNTVALITGHWHAGVSDAGTFVDWNRPDHLTTGPAKILDIVAGSARGNDAKDPNILDSNGNEYVPIDSPGTFTDISIVGDWLIAQRTDDTGATVGPPVPPATVGIAYPSKELYFGAPIVTVSETACAPFTGGPADACRLTVTAGAVFPRPGYPDVAASDKVDYRWTTSCGILGSTVGPTLTAQFVVGSSATCTATVEVTNQYGGKSSTKTIHFDREPPTVEPIYAPAPNAHGWWNSAPVNVTWDVFDNGGISYNDCQPRTINTSAYFGCMVTDFAGLTRLGFADVKIDSVLPTITASSRLPLPNTHGWNNTNVTLSYNCFDDHSGVATCPGSETLADNRANQSSTETALDRAGNRSLPAINGGINIDKVRPILHLTRTPAATDGWNNTDVDLAWTCEETLSGLDGACPSSEKYTSGVGHVVTRQIADLAGNLSNEVNVTINIDKMAPVLSVGRTPGANAHGWNNQDVTIKVICGESTSFGEQSGIAAGGCPVNEVLSTDDVRPAKTYAVSDRAGNTSTAALGAIKIDKTRPTLHVTRTPEAANGWNNTDVEITWTCEESPSGSGLNGACPSFAKYTSGVGHAITGRIADLAGNLSDEVNVTINIDKVAPVLSVGRTPGANAHGWNNEDVTVKVICGESTSFGEQSGIKAGDCPQNEVLSTDGAREARTLSVSDLAGNTSTAALGAIKIDKTRPTLIPDVSPAPTNGWNNTDVDITWTCRDDGAGVDGNCPSFEKYTSGVGVTVSRSIADKAGNLSDPNTGVVTFSIDKVPPSLSVNRSPGAGNAYGWNNTDVRILTLCVDALSGINPGDCPVNEVISTDGVRPAKTYTVSDRAGNSSSDDVPEIKIDKAHPDIDFKATPAPNAAGWNNTPVTVSFSCDDSLSGIDGTCPVPEMVAVEGRGLSRSGTVSDKAGNSFTATAGMNIDLTAPVFTFVPPAVIVAQHNAAGAAYVLPQPATATDALSGGVLIDVLGVPESNVYPVGTTIITFVAHDAAGNSSTATTTVTVRDTTAPTLSVADVTVTGSNPAVAGAAAAFSPVANDNVGVVSVVCAPASGTMFPFGKTPVSCTASDAAGNTTTRPFTVTVRDGVAPVVSAPANIMRDATSDNGAIVTFTAIASDNVSGSLAPFCSPASGSTFAIGATTVTCTATDAAANSGSASFTVTVSDVTTPGEMNGDGFIRGQAAKYAFDFRVIERIGRDVERGRFRLNVDYTARNKKSDRFEATDVTFIAFSDDPTIRPGRSRRPQIDTVRFSGVGSWNGKMGYAFEVLASDEGEPGRHRESVSIVVRSSSGAVVAQVDGELSGGNVQSRRIHR